MGSIDDQIIEEEEVLEDDSLDYDEIQPPMMSIPSPINSMNNNQEQQDMPPNIEPHKRPL